MKFETYLLLGVLLFGVWKTSRSVQRCQTPRERFFAMRASIFTWLVGFLLLVAFLFLPNRARVLLILPVFIGAVSVARLLRDARNRLRRESEARVDFERMKRVH